MNLAEIIDSRSVLPSLKAQSKKQLLQELAHAAATITGIDHRLVFETLLQREKLGSTGLGQGIAIPHGKFKAVARSSDCSPGWQSGRFRFGRRPAGRSGVSAARARSAGADHLKALARISRLLRDGEFAAKLRGTDTAEGLYAILTEPAASASHAA